MGLQSINLSSHYLIFYLFQASLSVLLTFLTMHRSTQFSNKEHQTVSFNQNPSSKLLNCSTKASPVEEILGNETSIDPEAAEDRRDLPPLVLPPLILPARSIYLKAMVKERANALILQQLPEKGFLGEYKSFCWNQNIRQFSCLPAIYLIGMTKCGTTNLFDKISLHDDIISRHKENHWWARARLGLVKHRPNKNTHVKSFETYLRSVTVPNMPDNKDKLIIDATPATIWEVEGWLERYPWAEEPPYSLADLIHLTTPHAKILAIFRNPTERLWSHYKFFPNIFEEQNDAEDFHDVVIGEISRFNGCLESYSLRRCCMSDDNDVRVRLNLGIYICYIQDWVEVFGENLKVISLESYKKDPAETLDDIFSFLNVPANVIWDEQLDALNSSSNKNPGKGEMKPETDEFLREFYRPYNVMLARYLQDSQFLFGEEHLYRLRLGFLFN